MSIMALALLLAPAPANAQQAVLGRTITTVAGLGPAATNSAVDNIPALSAQLGTARGVAFDSTGRFLYFSDATHYVVRRVDLQTGFINIIAGTLGTPGFSGDNGPATVARLGSPRGLAVDAIGNLYIADSSNMVVRMVNTDGIITTPIGVVNGQGFQDGLATHATFRSPDALTIDNHGLLYIVDKTNGLIRVFDPGTNQVSTAFGPTIVGYAVDMVPAGVAVENDGTIFFTDEFHHKIYTLLNGLLTPFAGIGSVGFSGDGGSAIAAQFSSPQGLALDHNGTLYVADRGNLRIRQIGTTGTATLATGKIRTVAGDGTAPTFQPALKITADAANGALPPIEALAIRPATGGLYLAGGNAQGEFGGTTGPGSITALLYDNGIVLPTGQTYAVAAAELLQDTTSVAFLVPGGPISQDFNIGASLDCVNDGTVTLKAGTVCHFPINFSASAPGRRFAQILVNAGSGDTLYGLEGSGYISQGTLIPGTIKKTPFVTGGVIFTGPGGFQPPAPFVFNTPTAIAYDGHSYTYITDPGVNTLYHVDFSNAVSRYVGNANGTPGFAGDGSQVFGAQLNTPTDVVIDAAGTIYIADSGNHRVRAINPDVETISTYAGDGGTAIPNDGALATAASLNSPIGLAIDRNGDLLITDALMHTVRRVDHLTHIITTVAGTGINGNTGDGGLATAATFTNPWGIAAAPNGDIYIADNARNSVRKIDGTTGLITTIAGTVAPGYTGDFGPPASATLNHPKQLLLDANGGLYIADTGNNVVRYITHPPAGSDHSPVILTVAGNPNAGGVANTVSALGTTLSGPEGMMLDTNNELIFAEDGAHDFRTVQGAYGVLAFPSADAATTTAPITEIVLQSGTTDPNLTSTFIPSVSYPTAASRANFDASNDTGTYPTCLDLNTTPLRSGDSCAIQFTFTPESSGSKAGTITVTEPSPLGPLTQLITVSGLGTGTVPFSFTPLTLPNALTSKPYSQTIRATGGAGDLTLTESGALPDGIGFSNTNGLGLLSGTTTLTEGSFPFSLTVTDANNATLTQNFTLEVGLGVVKIDITEAVHVLDTVVVTPAVQIGVTEAVHVLDNVVVTPAVQIGVSEAVHVLDAITVAPAVQIGINEPINVTDTPQVIPPNKTAQNITFAQPAGPFAYGDTFSPPVSSDSGLTPALSVVSGPATVTNNSVHLTGVGTVMLAANQPGDATYAAAPAVTRTITVNRATATIEPFNAVRIFSQPNPAFNYRVGGLVNGDTSANLGGAPLLTTTATLNSRAGQYPIYAALGTLPTTNYDYNFLSGTLTINGGIQQTITFLNIKDLPSTVHQITLTAHSTSALPITYTATGPASISGNKVNLTGPGVVSITAAQPGNATFLPATSVTRTFTVKP